MKASYIESLQTFQRECTNSSIDLHKYESLLLSILEENRIRAALESIRIERISTNALTDAWLPESVRRDIQQYTLRSDHVVQLDDEQKQELRRYKNDAPEIETGWLFLAHDGNGGQLIFRGTHHIRQIMYKKTKNEVTKHEWEELRRNNLWPIFPGGYDFKGSTI